MNAGPSPFRLAVPQASGGNPSAKPARAMHWIAPTEKDTASGTPERRLRDTADTVTRVSASPGREATWRDFRSAKDHWSANSGLKAQECSGPILGIILLRFAEVRFADERAKLSAPSPAASRQTLPVANQIFTLLAKSKPSAGRAICCCRVCCRGRWNSQRTEP